MFLHVHRWKTSTSDERTAEKKAREGSVSCEYQHFCLSKTHLSVSVFVFAARCLLT